MELALFSRIYQDLVDKEAYSNISNDGFNKLEVIANYNSKHFNIDLAGDNNYLKYIESLLNDNNLSICALSIHRDSFLVLGADIKKTSKFFKGSIEEQIEFGIKRTQLAAKAAHEFSIPVVIGYLGCIDFSQWYPWPYENWDEQIDTTYERWKPILNIYDKYGVKFAHEIAPNQIAYNTKSSIEIFERLDSPSFGFCIDPSNLMLMGLEPSTVIESLSSKILHVHGKDIEISSKTKTLGWVSIDNNEERESAIKFRIPGWGDVNWKKILSSLKTNNYNGIISLEIEDRTMTRKEAIKKAKNYLEPLLFE